jgi:NADH-quinone oxidoreductase subunit N
MIERIASLWPEIALFVTTCVVMVVGLSKSYGVRSLCALVSGVGLIVSFVLALTTSPGAAILPNLMPFAKAMIAGVGIMILFLLSGVVDRDEEQEVAAGRKFDPLRTNRAEFYAFFLFSLTGLMLCASADDLIWLFLALELTSLPTYVMVTISTRGSRSQEAGVKYFFLGALGAAVFLYGFALIYGGTGTTKLAEISTIVADGGMNAVTLAGVMMAIVGICFKLAAVPMHFYTADVYQGAAAPVSAMLAFVPKTAGFLALMLLLTAVSPAAESGWLAEPVRLLLWIIAALTMTVGNVLAILQTSVKRILAYSSIAHSGYMLVGLIAGPVGPGLAENGLSAVLFYLLTYGATNVGAFGVIACLERRAADGSFTECESIDDLKGLVQGKPQLAWAMALCALSLLGMPPLIGFFAKLPLFMSAISAGEIALVIVLGLNSAIAAYYYLRLVKTPLLTDPDPDAEPILETPSEYRKWITYVSAALVIALAVGANRFMDWSADAGSTQPAPGNPALEAEGDGDGAESMASLDRADRRDPR